MTPRNRLLFNLLLGLQVGVLPSVLPAARAAEPEVAPDQPGTGLRVLPPEAAKPKRRYTDRVTFHQTSPEAPVKPAKPADAPAGDPLAPQGGVKPFDARDFQAEAMQRPPPSLQLPSREEIEEARDKRNWLKSDSFQNEADRQDREMLDQALGLRNEDELRAEQDQDTPENDGLDGRRGGKEGDKPEFGDFFERMKERADALADVNFREDAPREPADPREQKEKDGQARDKADERRAGLAAGERKDETRGFTPSVGSAGAASPAAGDAPGTFSPSLATPAAGTAFPAGAAAAPGAGRPAETYTFQRSNELMASLGTPRAGIGSAPPAGPSLSSGFPTPPAAGGTGSFRSADAAFQRNEPLANLGGNPAAPTAASAFRPPEPAPAAPAPRSAFASPGGFGDPGRGGFGSRAPDTPSTSARLALQAESTPRLSSNFGGMKPLLSATPPAAATLAPRADRWERDRVQSQLMSDPAVRPGARRAAP